MEKYIKAGMRIPGIFLQKARQSANICSQKSPQAQKCRRATYLNLLLKKVP